MSKKKRPLLRNEIRPDLSRMDQDFGPDKIIENPAVLRRERLTQTMKDFSKRIDPMEMRRIRDKMRSGRELKSMLQNKEAEMRDRTPAPPPGGFRKDATEEQKSGWNRYAASRDAAREKYLAQGGKKYWE
tara:strand:- start:617 stop:1006 length:390 start_codon:yes stop_codon:yes gene_type:complete